MKVITFLILNFIILSVHAEVYKCTDASGNTVYSASVCPDGYHNIEIDLNSGSKIDLDAQKSQSVLEQERQLIELKKQVEHEQKTQKKHAQWRQHVLDESAKNQFLIKGNPTQFAPFAIPPYLPDNLSDNLKEYAERLADIERLRRIAANKALDSKQCDRVESDELDSRSNKNLLIFSIDCSNGQHLSFTEQQLSN